MPNISDSFWTDDQQAAERLAETFILKGDEVVYVQTVEAGQIYHKTLPSGALQAEKLDSPVWNKFRKLPPLGWLNVSTNKFVGAVYMRRRAVRSRSHGLNNTNIQVFGFHGNGGVLAGERLLSMTAIYGAGLYKDPDQYPGFRDVFAVLKTDSSAALSSKFAIYKDAGGLVWLYRKRRRIGLIPDVATVLLFRGENFYREDILANHNILPVEVREL